MKSLINFSLVAIFFSSFLNSQVLNIEELKAAPRGLARDYYIYRYINEKKPSKKEIAQLKPYVYRYAGKIKSKIEDKIGAQKQVTLDCRGINANNLLEANATCQNAIVTIKYLQTLSIEKRKELADKFKNVSPSLANFITGFDMPDPVLYYINTNDTASYLKYYNASRDKEKFLNEHNLTSKFVAKISSNRQFKALINDIVINRKYNEFRHNLIRISSSDLIDSDVAFLLGLNAILFHRDEDALRFFSSAAKNATAASKRDNANFWVYLITKDKKLLKTIAKSSDINIYSLYAREFSGGGKIKIIVPNPKIDTLLNYDYTDPLAWQRVKNSISKMDSAELLKYGARFFTKSTIGEYSYIMEKAHNYKLHFYPTPFMEDIGSDDTKRKALILALARQESRFVPSAVSTSYALGMMQFMPFLANHIGKKELKIEGFDQDDMFKPSVAYKFANRHLDYLEKYLSNPVFIAYAYNGGIGFTKRMLQKGDLFNKNSVYKKYEPFLSMELVPYAESRNYAKKVLSNYIIYLAILNSNTKISQFFENLMIPGESEKFRLDL